MLRKANSWIYRHVRMAVSAGTIVILLLVILLSLRETGTVDALVGNASGVAQEVEGAALAPLISYQARLTNPTSGAPLNGSYTFVFRIYNVESGGSELWSELKDLTATNGLVSTLLGDTTALPTAIFNGQNLWLGIKIGADAEATPRQRLSAVPYAMYTDNADRLDGQDSAFFRNAGNLNAGTVAEARIDPLVARDSEIKEIVAGSDGAGSGLDADLLDGLNSTAFAPANHNHDPLYVNTAGPDSISAKIANGAVFTVTQLDSGNGIYASTVSIEAGEAALRGVAGAAGPTLDAVSGVWGTSATGRGVTGSSNTEDGVLGFSNSGTGVDGQSLTGIGVRAFSSSGTALQVDGPAVFNGTISNPFVPIALGFINADGSKNAGSANFTSLWNAANSRYEITISGHSYFFNTFVTNITPVCAAHTVRTSSVGGKLLVFVQNSAGTPVQCDFQFVTFKP